MEILSEVQNRGVKYPFLALIKIILLMNAKSKTQEGPYLVDSLAYCEVIESYSSFVL